MKTTTPRLDTAHPPCPDEQTAAVAQTIAIPADLTALKAADRLSLRIGLWLLLRAQRPKPQPRAQRNARARRADLWPPENRPITQREAFALLTYDLQRQLR